MQSEVAVTRLSSCECCVECIHRILEYAPMVLAYCGAVVRCVRHVYGDLHREDLPVQPFPRCRRCFFCRHAVMFELSSLQCWWPLVALAPLWFSWLVLDAPSIIPVSIHASSAPCRLHTSSIHPSTVLAILFVIPPLPSSSIAILAIFAILAIPPPSHIADLHTTLSSLEYSV